MTAKEFLTEYERAYKKTLSIEAEIEDIRAQSVSITQELSPDKVQTSHEPDKIGALIAKLVDMQEDLYEAKKHEEDVMDAVKNVINKLEDPDCLTVLWWRYIRAPEERCHNKWDWVEDELPYSRTSLFNIHKKGLKEVSKLI